MLIKTGLAEFKRRRQALMNCMAENSMAMIPAASLIIRNRYVTHPFRQDSDFFYLTGLEEPDSLLVLIPGREAGQVLLFCPDYNPKRSLWHGASVTPENAAEWLGVDDAFPLEDIDDIVPGLIESRTICYCTLGHNTEFDKRLNDWQDQLSEASVAPSDLADLSYLLHELRLIKSSSELRHLRKAGRITASAHNRAMQQVSPGKFEYQLDAEIQHEFAMSGARRAAYCSIVASGPNACTLHYLDNRRKMKAGELVLVDAGCEINYYAADVTRTYPVSGVFSTDQRALYDWVLRAQLAAIDEIKPGKDFNQSHLAAYQTLQRGLAELGITENENEDISAWFMHRTAHWLGMDVHDVGDYRIADQWRMLEPGMVLAVEPGIYFHPDDNRVPDRWRGLGIRIEDMVLVTRQGNDVLSAEAIKAPEDIEQWMNQGQASLF